MTVSTLGSPKSMSNLIFPFSSELTNAFYIMYFDCRRMVNVRPDGSLEVMVTVQCGRRDGDVRWVVYQNEWYVFQHSLKKQVTKVRNMMLQKLNLNLLCRVEDEELEQNKEEESEIVQPVTRIGGGWRPY